VHGFAHVNHEPDGRKSEFGPRRDLGAQRRDLEAGRRRLELLLGDAVAPFFTPPWNRCTESTAQILADLGFRALSRDARERPFDIPGFLEVPVRVDWLRPPADIAATGERLAAEGRSGSPVGVMLHPARIEAEDRRWLSELLALVGRHVGARCRSMRSLAGDRSLAGRTP
jgi:peptidoglycan/xylan/chitin deacetylase (PgdA/CDA1 family)